MTSYSEEEIKAIERKKGIQTYSSPGGGGISWDWGKVFAVIQALAIFAILAHCILMEIRFYRLQQGLQQFGQGLKQAGTEINQEMEKTSEDFKQRMQKIDQDTAERIRIMNERNIVAKQRAEETRQRQEEEFATATQQEEPAPIAPLPPPQTQTEPQPAPRVRTARTVRTAVKKDARWTFEEYAAVNRITDSKKVTTQASYQEYIRMFENAEQKVPDGGAKLNDALRTMSENIKKASQQR